MGSRRRHIVGGDEGGGFEWSGTSNGALSGITSIELRADGKITNLSEMYDGRMVPADALIRAPDSHRRGRDVGHSVASGAGPVAQR